MAHKPDSSAANDETKMRVDLFLYRTRFFKSRSAAADAVSSGLRLSRDDNVRRVDKASTSVQVGDVLSITKNNQVITLTIKQLPDRRGPATEAQSCYAISDD